MADKFFYDQFSWAHLAAGIIVYYMGITFEQWFWLHLLFEIVENGSMSRKMAQKYIPKFGWDSPIQDTIINTIGDQVFAIIGWLIAYFVNTVLFKHKATPFIKNELDPVIS